LGVGDKPKPKSTLFEEALDEDDGDLFLTAPSAKKKSGDSPETKTSLFEEDEDDEFGSFFGTKKKEVKEDPLNSIFG